ncbi:hypothetical protein F5Y16DRAFT_380269 [Xylariaceae sp. FL0255]|nr:hypothetical protein F5Y16DRAFT_380269 [Xylariaceae sp. FL0255]
MLPTNSAQPSTSHSSAHQTTKPHRVLACQPCQQRKIKCNRKTPCSNCVKSDTNCVAASLAPRKRRFPERALLDRLRHYEALLREHDIPFQPLHSSHGDISLDEDDGDLDEHSPASSAREPSSYSSPKDLLKDLYLLNHDGSEVLHSQGRIAAIAKIWDTVYKDGDHLLLGQRATPVDLCTFHPDPAIIFRLWQVYLDNVDPLLKVTHSPSLQSRIVDAMTKLADVSAPLEALMFSIYCISIKSLSDHECHHIFGQDKPTILSKYHLACQEALLNCGYTRTSDRDCLTAAYLYLLSAGQSTDPRSVASVLGLLMRIAQRMGIHLETINCKCNAHEAEMRRRLWWSLAAFDARMSELTDFKSSTLIPGWNCKIPLNISDSELRVDIKFVPAPAPKPTEAIFCVVRSEIAQFVRHSAFHLEFAYPTLKPLATAQPDELSKLEQLLEEKYFPSFDEENRLELMTLCTARGWLAKYRLVNFYFAFPSSSSPRQPTEAQRAAAMSFAFTILENDTKVMSSELTKGFTWLTSFFFPAPAYIHLAQCVKRKPLGPQADRAWQLMSENHMARFSNTNDSHLIILFSGIIMETWEACETAARDAGTPITVPPIISRLQEVLARTAADAQASKDEGTSENNTPIPPLNAMYDIPLSAVTATMPPNFPFEMGNLAQLSDIDSWPGISTDILGTMPMNNFWSSMSWGLGGRGGW